MACAKCNRRWSGGDIAALVVVLLVVVTFGVGFVKCRPDKRMKKEQKKRVSAVLKILFGWGLGAGDEGFRVTVG